MSDPHSAFPIAKINDLSRGGSGVAKLDTGEVVFVPFTAPGDEVSIRITEKSKTYSQGEIVEIIQPSPLRIKPPCPVFTQCGGCSWQHIPYDLQFETKKKGVLHTLKRVGLSIEAGNLPAPDLLPAKTVYHYRNRIQLRGNPGGAGNFGAPPSEKAFGYYARGSNQIISIEQCEIAHPKINKALPDIIKKAAQDFKREFKVEIEVDEKDEVRVAWNQKHAAFGFRQIHSEQNELLKTWVKSAAIAAIEKETTGNTVLLDLYGGDGNLSQDLVSHYSEIHCVDLSTPDTKAAHLPAHFKYHQSPITHWLRTFNLEALKNKSVTVILDPPREGLGNDFSEIFQPLSKLNLNGIILVGCDADAFARDIQRFVQKDLKLKKLAVLDLFPQTPHVESLALLSK